jgi:hypothetical protein
VIWVLSTSTFIARSSVCCRIILTLAGLCNVITIEAGHQCLERREILGNVANLPRTCRRKAAKFKCDQ